MKALCLSILVCSVSLAQPPHPRLDHGIDPARAPEYEKAAETVMAMSEEQMLSFVPDKHFTRFCECPKCEGGTQGDNVFAWRVTEPEQLTCRLCGFVWAAGGDCPEDRVLEGKNSLGETRTFGYHQSAGGIRHFFSQHIAYHKRLWIIAQGRALGRAFLATGKPEYARRAALILDRVATVYPHYAVIRVGGMPNRVFEFAPNQSPPYTWDAGKWGWHYPGGELPDGVIDFYDMVHDSPEFDRLSQERGYDVRARIDNDFLRPVFEAVRAGKSHISNYVAYLGTAAQMGIVVGEPSWVHWAVGWIGENINAGCFYDGMWHESPSYHYMTVSGLRGCFSSVRGYSDPPGYLDETDQKRFDDFDPDREFPFWSLVQRAPEVLDFPTGCSTVVHDTWSNQVRSRPRDETRSTILPGFGHASLGRGQGGNQLQAQLHFSGAYGHHHLDNLNLCIWAKGREMLSDVGYSWTDIRSWTVSTISHNLVAVNGQEQSSRQSDGNLLQFFPETAGVSMVEADGARGYANIPDLDLYRRLIAVIPVSDADAYILDLFRVRGGQVHDWLGHADADFDSSAQCSLALGNEIDSMAELALPEGCPAPSREYGKIRRVRSATAQGAFTATCHYADDPSRGLRIHLLTPGAVDVFLGESPSIRRAGTGNQGDSRKALDYWMPHLIARRQADAGPLDSTFAAIHEPFSGGLSLAGVEPLAVTPDAPGAVALRVSHGEFTDTILATIGPDASSASISADGVELTGRLGIVRRHGANVVAMWMLSASRVACGEDVLNADCPDYSGTVEAGLRKASGADVDAFVTDADLPTGETLRGSWMIVTHGGGYTHGYEIDRVEEREGRRVVVLTADHGLTIDGAETREAYFPRRTFRGDNTFTIPTRAALKSESGTGGA